MVERKTDVAHIDVRYVADLARIELNDEEAERFGGELDAILEYVAQLEELDLEGIEPTAHAAPRVNVMREDEVRAGLDRDVVIANAPADVDEAYIRVPVVIDEGSSS